MCWAELIFLTHNIAGLLRLKIVGDDDEVGLCG